MVARIRHEPDALAVVFERDGEEPIHFEAADGDRAMIRAVAILLAHRRLQAGDRLTVIAADGDAGARPRRTWARAVGGFT